MHWITPGRCVRPEHDRAYGGVCIVSNVTAMDVQGQFIRRQEMQKIIQKTSVGPLIGAHTNRKFLERSL
jgi:hypothetical protein